MKPFKYLMTLSHHHLRSTILWLSLITLLGFFACKKEKLAVEQSSKTKSGLEITGTDLKTVLKNNSWLSPLKYDYIHVKVSRQKGSVTYVIPILKTRSFICLTKTRANVSAFLLKMGFKRTASGAVIQRAETVDIGSLVHRVFEGKKNKISLIKSEVFDRADFTGSSGSKAHLELENPTGSPHHIASEPASLSFLKKFWCWLSGGVYADITDFCYINSVPGYPGNGGGDGGGASPADGPNSQAFSALLYDLYSGGFLSGGGDGDPNPGGTLGDGFTLPDIGSGSGDPFLDAIKQNDLDGTPDQFISIYDFRQRSIWPSSLDIVTENSGQLTNFIYTGTQADNVASKLQLDRGNPPPPADRQLCTTSALRAFFKLQSWTNGLSGVQLNQLIGRSFQEAALKSIFGPNYKQVQYSKYSSYRERYTGRLSKAVTTVNPDYIGPAYNKEPGEGIREFPNYTYIEVKAAKGPIYLSTNNYQIMGEIDAISREIQTGNNTVHPNLYFVTTSDTQISQSVIDFANALNVRLLQSVVELTYNGQIRVEKPRSLTNWWEFPISLEHFDIPLLAPDYVNKLPDPKAIDD